LPTRKRRLYWDACCFIALFNSESTTPRPQLDALRTTFDEMLAGKIKIITSDAYRAEVFGKDRPEGQAIAEQFEACPHFEIVPLRTQAWDMAGEMRKRCQAARPPRSLKLGDALHIVGGTIARVDEIWTTDAKLVSYYEDGLLTSVVVCLPYLKQLNIEF
jgi:hypothetical protein